MILYNKTAHFVSDSFNLKIWYFFFQVFLDAK